MAFYEFIGFAKVKREVQPGIEFAKVNPFLTFGIFNMFKNFSDVISTGTESHLSDAFSIL
jgi:hypothetical protein